MRYHGRATTRAAPPMTLPAGMQDAWNFVTDEKNRTVLAWIGAGLLAAIVALVRVLRPKGPASVVAHGGVAIGGKALRNKIKITNWARTDPPP